MKRRVLLLSLLAGMAGLFPHNSAAVDFRELLSRERPPATHRLAYGPLPGQFGDLWLPATKGPHPVVIMIHGGCWQASLPGVELMAYIAEDLRKHGVAVWNIEYRRLGTSGAGYPGTFLDIADGVDYLRQLAKPYALDLAHIAAAGHSAGGQLALWAAARGRIGPASPLYRKHPLPLQAVVTLAGINDLAAYRARGPAACGGPGTIDRLVDAKGRAGQDVYADTSPAAMLPLGVSQVVVSGGDDPIVPAGFGQDYGKAALAAGDRVETLTIPEAGHFELVDPQSAAWARIRASLLRQIRRD